MPLLINRELVTDDSWQRVDEETLATTSGDIIVPFALYQENQDSLKARDGAVTILINGEDDFDAVLAVKDQFDMIAIEFPAFTDGRGFSLARLLRRAGYQGQLRAVGDVAHDRLGYMERCGFDAFDIPAERYTDEVVNAFAEISVRYQGCADDERPVYRQ